jgi:lipopolysaccharide transport system ATP-binding protein
MTIAIKFENISKQYRLGEVGTGTLSNDLHRAWARLRGKPDPFATIGSINDRTQVKRNTKREDTKRSVFSRLSPRLTRNSDACSDYVWALNDINFRVEQGQILGIIGRNGAGKSTLLKILSRVTAPTTGRIKAKGRIASLLEVGTGFHPELTGRENIYLNGAILGMRRYEISGQLEEIVEFSGCARYIDTPVKRYSSGMIVRLGFAVAAHLDSEILVVDEVLAVGDSEFQKKCLGKMKDISRQSGRTILFVSHNMMAVRALCTAGVLFKNGSVESIGEANQIADKYLSLGTEQSTCRTWSDETAPADEYFRLKGVRALNPQRESAPLFIEEDLHIEVDFDLLESHNNVSVSIHIMTQGTCAFVGGNVQAAYSTGSYRSTCTIPAGLLNDTTYSVTVFLITNSTEFRIIQRDVIDFSVEESLKRIGYLGTMTGVVRPKLAWRTEHNQSLV